MKVYILAGSAFEARDLGRSLGLNPRDVIICHSEVVLRGKTLEDGDLILETTSARQHAEYERMAACLLRGARGKDVRWEQEPRP